MQDCDEFVLALDTLTEPNPHKFDTESTQFGSVAAIILFFDQIPKRFAQFSADPEIFDAEKCDRSPISPEYFLEFLRRMRAFSCPKPFIFVALQPSV